MQSKPSRVFPRTFKPATVNRIIALDKGMRRKHVKLSRAGTKRAPKAPKFATPDARDCYIANKYRRDLSHLCR